MMPRTLHAALATLAVAAALSLPASAAEHVTLRNGSDFLCSRREPAGDHVRLYLYPTSRAAAAQPAADADYIEVSAASVLSVEVVPDPPLPASPVAPDAPHREEQQQAPHPGSAETPQLLARAGALHHIDADLLASVVQAESAGDARAVSRAGAQGLMQLMPSTAADLGVANAFAPDQNIGGGSAYLDQLLDRYDPHNDTHGLALALAAYNAGPAAVDRYHGIPPYAETRAYVARVIREFNRRKAAAGLNSHSGPLAAN